MNNQNYNNNNQGTQVIDKGRIVVAVEKYPVKENGQLVLVPGTQTPKTKKNGWPWAKPPNFKTATAVFQKFAKFTYSQ